jgi:hypothetical protein
LVDNANQWWGDMVRIRNNLVNTLTRLAELNTERAQFEFPTCCEPHCETQAEKAGRCGRHYQRKRRWEQDHPGELAPPAPADNPEPPRRIHITGPFKETA